jgi:hypothetical protein
MSDSALPPLPTHPLPGSHWKHFKGNEYEVVCLARDCEEPERLLVVYRSMKGDVWVRPLFDFLGVHESGVTRFKQIAQPSL